MKPRLLDLFCGAGGASMGYHRAGFEVVGVDIEPQKNYPFEFIQADAMHFPLEGFDVIHASPPCQAHTAISNRSRVLGMKATDHEDLCTPTLERLRLHGSCFVVENVVGAPLEFPIKLTGEMFGLGVYRPRLFHCEPMILGPPRQRRQKNPVAVYGKLDGRRLWNRKDGTMLKAATLETACKAMGIDWMTDSELSQAIPPAYTKWIGRRIIETSY